MDEPGLFLSGGVPRECLPVAVVVAAAAVVVVVGCWLLVVVCCLLFVVCCLLFVVCCLLSLDTGFITTYTPGICVELHKCFSAALAASKSIQ